MPFASSLNSIAGPSCPWSASWLAPRHTRLSGFSGSLVEFDVFHVGPVGPGPACTGSAMEGVRDRSSRKGPRMLGVDSNFHSLSAEPAGATSPSDAALVAFQGTSGWSFRG